MAIEKSKREPNPEPPERVVVPCRVCARDTEHAVLKKVETAASNEDGDWEGHEWQIIRCGGCRNHAFRQGWAWGDDFDYETGKVNWNWTIYPKPQLRMEAVAGFELPEPVRQLYTETLIAFNHDAATLAAAGLRAVVEATCKDQGCIQKSLALQINELVAKGVFLKRDADYLHTHRFLGNEAVHEMGAPPKAEFELALKILEHLLDTVYTIPLLNEDLRKLRQARGARVQ